MCVSGNFWLLSFSFVLIGCFCVMHVSGRPCDIERKLHLKIEKDYDLYSYFSICCIAMINSGKIVRF